jgi:hypothetical protein
VNRYDSTAVTVGLVSALIAFPFSLGLGALATKMEILVSIFWGSSLFTFKSVVGLTEIAVFGLAAYVSQTTRRKTTGSQVDGI